ncbi:MAG: DUF87 domain-containing protein [Candidatus Parvarchaeota archaeon]
MIVIGQTGSGKSFLVKMQMMRYMLRDNQSKIYILDPLREYVRMAQRLGGTVIDIVNNVINPLDLKTTASTAYPRGDIRDKVNRVLTMLNIYFEGLNDQMLSILSNALTRLYTESGREVIFSDLINQIKIISDFKTNTNAQLLVESLSIFVDGSLKNLNRQTTVSLDNDIVVFDLSKTMDDRMREFYLFFMTDFLYGQVSRDLERKLVFIDEARYFMLHERTASFISSFVRHARHYNCGVTLITQSIGDFYTEEGGEFGIDLLNNAYSVVVFTNKDIPKKFIESHRLTDDEVRFIRSDTGIQHPAGGKPYSQCLLIQKDRRFRLVVEGLELESDLATTNPEDLRERGERSA